jgi:transposase-like protein
MRTRLPDRDDTWTPEQARLVLDEWRRSGESIAAFARRHDVSPARLYWWRKQLSGDIRFASPALALVPGRVTAKTAAEAAVAVRLRGDVTIEIVDPTPSWVAALVAELAKALP